MTKTPLVIRYENHTIRRYDEIKRRHRKWEEIREIEMNKFKKEEEKD